MRAHEVSFLDLVQGEKQFQVPLYQRTYSWSDNQLTQLWRDLLEQAEGMATAAGRPGHFIGSIVLAPSPSLAAGGVQRWLVVDGQQRLTTLMLVLAAIRDHVRVEDEQPPTESIGNSLSTSSVTARSTCGSFPRRRTATAIGRLSSALPGAPRPGP